MSADAPNVEIANAPTTGDGDITVTIKQLDGQTYGIQCNLESTVGTLKQSISNERDLARERQRLIYRAQELKNDNSTLASYNVIDGATVHMVIRPIGSIPSNPPPAEGDAVINMPQPPAYGRWGYGDEGQQAAMMQQQQNAGADGAAPAPAALADAGMDALAIVRLCRFVRIFALIDGVFLLLYGFSFTPFFILAAFAFSGYWGAKTLNRKYLILYIICLLCEIALRGFLIYKDDDTVSVILYALMILIDLFVLRCVIQLYRAVPSLGEESRNHVLVLNRMGLI